MGRKENLLSNLEKRDTVEALLHNSFHPLECARPRRCTVLEFYCSPILFDKVQFTMILWIEVTEVAAQLDKLLQLELLRAEIRLRKNHKPATTVCAISRTLELRALCMQPPLLGP